MNRERLVELMLLAVQEASQSTHEDSGPRPFVGAVLADRDGHVLAKAHRGEAPGIHAEQHLLTVKWTEAIPDGAVLLTTLEPCVHRGAHTRPCADEIVFRGIRHVVIGTLDPNPNITGRGEMQLAYEEGVQVDRFTPELNRQLTQLNSSFFEYFRENYSVSDSALRTSGGVSRWAVQNARKSSDRNRLLTQSLGVIAKTTSDFVSVGAGLSWVRDAFVSLLSARLQGRRIQLVSCPPADPIALAGYQTATKALSGIGVEHRFVERRPPILGTFCFMEPGDMTAMTIDFQTADLVSSADAPGLTFLLQEYIDDLLNSATLYPSANHEIEFEKREIDDINEILRTGVPQYDKADFGFVTIPIEEIRPLTGSLEYFKLFRSRRIDILRATHKLPSAFSVRGAPQWIFTPPIVERHGNNYVAIDGTHRLYDGHRIGKQAAECILIENVAAALPARPLGSWGEVTPTRTKLAREHRYQDYDAAAFRPIRAALSAEVEASAKD